MSDHMVSHAGAPNLSPFTSTTTLPGARSTSWGWCMSGGIQTFSRDGRGAVPDGTTSVGVLPSTCLRLRTVQGIGFVLSFRRPLSQPPELVESQSWHCHPEKSKRSPASCPFGRDLLHSALLLAAERSAAERRSAQIPRLLASSARRRPGSADKETQSRRIRKYQRRSEDSATRRPLECPRRAVSAVRRRMRSVIRLDSVAAQDE